MRAAAARVAAMAFFAIALAGALSGVPPEVCAYRAAIGAAVMFVLALVAGRLVIQILIETMLGPRRASDPGKDQARDTDHA
jgi:hypothetical protein